MIKRLRIKLIAVSMLSVIIVLGAIVTAMNVINYSRMIKNADNMISILEKKTDKNNSTGRKDDVPNDLKWFEVIIKEDGTTEKSSDKITNMGPVKAANETEISELTEKAYNSEKKSGFIGTFRYTKNKTDNGTTLIFLDRTRELDSCKNFLFVSIICSIAGIGAVFVLVIIFSRRIVRPVAESYEKQKEFITNAGHEIKTPLAIIRADAEVLSMEESEKGNDENEWIKDIFTQTDRMTKLTEGLIYLSKMEEKSEITKKEFELSSMAEEIVKSFSSLAITNGKKIDKSIESNLEMCGDERSIRELMNILLDNAVKYADNESSVRFTVRKNKKSVIIQTENKTSGITSEDVSHMFDRFYRADKSHNSDRLGFGIGLSVANAIVKANNGKVKAELKEDNIVLISVIL